MRESILNPLLSSESPLTASISCQLLSALRADRAQVRVVETRKRETEAGPALRRHVRRQRRESAGEARINLHAGAEQQQVPFKAAEPERLHELRQGCIRGVFAGGCG